MQAKPTFPMLATLIYQWSQTHILLRAVIVYHEISKLFALRLTVVKLLLKPIFYFRTMFPGGRKEEAHEGKGHQGSLSGSSPHAAP